MKKNMLTNAVAAGIIVILLISMAVQAQERSRVQPAFPIGAGEQMIVYGGGRIFSDSALQSSTTTFQIPVGTVIKRILVEYADTNATAGVDMTTTLYREKVADAFNTRIDMRTVTSAGISSSNINDVKEKISNPLSHTVLQGWRYAVTTTVPGTQGANELQVVAVKVLYEPAP